MSDNIFRRLVVLGLIVTLILTPVGVAAYPADSHLKETDVTLNDLNFLKPVKIEKTCELSRPKLVGSKLILDEGKVKGSISSRILHCAAVAYNAVGMVLFRLDLYVEWAYDGSRIIWVDYWSSASAYYGWVVDYHRASVSYASQTRWRITATGSYYFAPYPNLRGYLITHGTIYSSGTGSCS